MLNKFKIKRNQKLIPLWRYVVNLPVLLFLGSLLLLPGSVLCAAPCDPASDPPCQSCASNGERLECKFDALADEGDKLVGHLKESSFITPAQMKGLDNAKDRFEREKTRLKPEDFRLLTKKKNASCQVVEAEGVDGNEDGVCDIKVETCAEVKGDDIGDEDGICIMKGPDREVCAQICDEEATLYGEDTLDDDALATEIESTYDAMTGHLKEVNESVVAVALSAPSPRVSGLLADPCALDPTLDRTSDDDYKKAKWAAMGSRAAADFAERFCDQGYPIFFGTITGAWVCAAVEGVVLGMNQWLNVLDIREADLDAQVIDATLACASQAMGASGQTADQIKAVQDKVNAVKAKQASIIQIINTPSGQRPDYPKP